MDIPGNLEKIKSQIPQGVKLVAVSKTRSEEEIMQAYNSGHRIFGENKVQELTLKHQNLPKDIEWHMIGHLQRNKVKYIAPFVHLIHGVDSFKLLQEIDKEANKNRRKQYCLLQVHIAQEDTKFGFSKDELMTMLNSDEYKILNHIEIHGVMGMATFTNNKDQIRSEFRFLHDIFQGLKQEIFKNSPTFRELSMGMSDDYTIALEEGSTMIRVGSYIFGERQYLKNE